MVEILKKEYWSKADAFLLPLTGLSKSEKYEVASYLYWGEFSIDDFKLILTYRHDNQEQFLTYCREHIFPILDKKNYLVESYDMGNRSIFILDISEWALDIQMLLAGKYSKFSREAKKEIEKYHLFNGNKVPIYIYGVLYPNQGLKLLDGMTPMEYISEKYEISLQDLQKFGEIGSIYDEMSETLIADVSELCQSDT